MLAPMATMTLWEAASLGALFLGDRARIPQLLVDGANLLEVADVLGGRDDRSHRRMAFRRRTDVDELDASGRVCDCLEVLPDLIRAGESAVGAEREAEIRFRGRNRLRRLRGERTRPNDD